MKSDLKTKYRFIYIVVVIFLLMAGLVESIRQIRESKAIRNITEQIVRNADATDNLSKIIAIRKYLQTNVTYLDAPYLDSDRPFLRSTALDTLDSGKGYCGEVTRTFINMAASVGVRAQRINLDGKNKHVVAEAEIEPGNAVIVDCQFPPQIKELEKLDQIILRKEYHDYYTLNLRRLRMTWIVSRVKTQIGFLTWWTENPHLLLATTWFSLAFGLIGIKGLRDMIRALLHKRGWVHVSNLQRVGATIPDKKI